MAGRRLLGDLQLLICPTCGAPQESPGSTVCELCGADLKRPSARRPSRSSPLRRVARPLRASVRAISRGITSAVLAGFLAARIAILLLLLASLVMGASFVPEVNALVPGSRAVAAIARPLLQRAKDWAAARLASWELEPRPQSAATQSSVIPQKAATPRFQATQAVLIISTPSGATVRVNARTMGKTPLTLKLAAGSYKVTISRPGYTTVTRTITVRQGKPASLGVNLELDRPSPRPPAPPSGEPSGKSPHQHDQKNDDP